MATILWAALASATEFNPEADETLSDYAAGANADMTTEFNIPAPGANFAELATFTPPDWEVPAGWTSASGPDDVPLGAVVGTLSTTELSLGLINSACVRYSLMPTFTMLNANADTTDTFSYDPDDPNQAISKPTWPGYEKDGGLELAVRKYPDFINNIEELRGKKVHARYYGHTVVAGSEVALQFVVLEPGELGPAEWGYASVTVLNDPTAVSAPSPITDFCSPLGSMNTVYGFSKDNPDTTPDESGYVVRTNPACPGTFTFHWKTTSLRDADNDGIENNLDTCPFDANVGDSRVPGSGDADDDGLDVACDDDDNNKKGPPNNEDCGTKPLSGDWDCDGYLNRGDNCPFVANGTRAGEDNQEDRDHDGIGDACDTTDVGSGPDIPDGHNHEVTRTKDVKITGEACAVEGTLTPTPTPTPEQGVVETATPTITPTPTPVPGGGCGIPWPGTYTGRVLVDGKPATDGSLVTASIGGEPWGYATVSDGRYDMDIPYRVPTAPPCFTPGTIQFTLDGMTCSPSPTFQDGLNEGVDLECAAAATPTVTVTATPAKTATPRVTVTVSPTRTVTATPAKLPPTGVGGLPGTDRGLPLWAMLLAGWASVMTAAGLGILVAKR